MKKQLFLIFLVTVSYCSVGQNRVMDSLWAVYNNKEQTDTIRLAALYDIAWSFRNNNPDTAIILAQQQLILANSITPDENRKKGAGKAFSTLGVAYSH